MTALAELMADRARQAQARFFIRAGRAKGLRCGDGVSGELFGLPLILEAEGLAANPELQRCREAIASAAREWAA
jgi:hypothetical protein